MRWWRTAVAIALGHAALLTVTLVDCTGHDASQSSDAGESGDAEHIPTGDFADGGFCIAMYDGGQCPGILPWACYYSASLTVGCCTENPSCEGGPSAGCGCCGFVGSGPMSCPGGGSIVCCTSADPSSCSCMRDPAQRATEYCYSIDMDGACC
jgi:hypothetical protein